MMVAVVLLAGCSASQDLKNPQEEQKMFMKQGYEMENYLEHLDIIGKTAKELGISLKTGESACDTNGVIFDASAKGQISFRKDASGGELIADTLYITVKQKNFWESFRQLVDSYSGPVSYGEEPYVESNGGSVQWFFFDAGAVNIMLSQASKYNYYSVSIQKNDMPTSTNQLQVTNVSTSSPQDEISVKNYQNGILTLKVSQRLGEETAKEEEFTLHEAAEDGNGYYSLNQIDSMCRNWEPVKVTQSAEASGDAEIALDLRVFGKVFPGDYMAKVGNLRIEFSLVEE